MKKPLKSIPRSDSAERVDGSFDDASDKIDGKKPPMVSVIIQLFLRICVHNTFVQKYQITVTTQIDLLL